MHVLEWLYVVGSVVALWTFYFRYCRPRLDAIDRERRKENLRRYRHSAAAADLPDADPAPLWGSLMESAQLTADLEALELRQEQEAAQRRAAADADQQQEDNQKPEEPKQKSTAAAADPTDTAENRERARALLRLLSSQDEQEGGAA